MSSLASALEEAEKRIIAKTATLSKNGRKGEYFFEVDGWEFGIDTKAQPWRVYHVQMTNKPQKTPGVGDTSR
jgi:hypothetical protein